MHVLRSFEMAFRLMKDNFAKSNMVGINIEEKVVRGSSHFLACNVGSVPFKHPGVPVRANPRRTSAWKPIIDSIKLRLIGWKSRKLSIGGRTKINNSVLSSLLLFLFQSSKQSSRRNCKIAKNIALRGR